MKVALRRERRREKGELEWELREGEEVLLPLEAEGEGRVSGEIERDRGEQMSEGGTWGWVTRVPT